MTLQMRANHKKKKKKEEKKKKKRRHSVRKRNDVAVREKDIYI